MTIEKQSHIASNSIRKIIVPRRVHSNGHIVKKAKQSMHLSKGGRGGEESCISHGWGNPATRRSYKCLTRLAKEEEDTVYRCIRASSMPLIRESRVNPKQEQETCVEYNIIKETGDEWGEFVDMSSDEDKKMSGYRSPHRKR
eukprot:scaffold42966_cov56-Attheya_sp.AAC.1